MNWINNNQDDISEFLIILSKILNQDNKNYCTVCENILNVKGMENNSL